MRMKNYYMPTLRETPAEAEIASHILLLRSGMIRKSAMGVYSYLPLGQRVIKKIEEITRKHMDSHGAQEVLMSVLQPQEIWEQSGRWKTFGPEMFKLSDRHNNGFCLGPTAEEYFTYLVKGELQSYKQLPLNIYQIQTKYRDEKRPRFGINRAREFIMKDAYTFDKSYEDLEKSYMNMWDAYEKVFDELKLEYRVVEGDSGSMGGNKSHEFVALSDVGEGVIAYCDKCGYSATDEKVEVVIDDINEDEKPLELEKVYTEDSKTIEEISSLLNVDKNRCVKAVDLVCDNENIIAFIPGDRELSMTKLINYLGVAGHELEIMDDELIKEITKADPGFTGPIGLKNCRVIIDKRVTKMKNVVIGANETNYHYINANYGRDFEGEIVSDLVEVKEGDKCPKCGETLNLARGIEVGNIFQLGTKYSEALDAKFLDENGKEQYFIMGSYGIGITRSITAIVEQNHDEDGIIWPMSVAPFHVIITLINTNDKEQVKLAEYIYETLQSKGVEVLLDDRKDRAGVKFKDRDLIGVPLRITVGKNAGENLVEFSTRKDRENNKMVTENAIDTVISLMKKDLNA